MVIKELIKSVLNTLAKILFPSGELILFESVPEYSDNTKAVFDEMVKRGINNKTKLIWVCEKKDAVERLKNKFADVNGVSAVWVKSFYFKYYLKFKAKAFIVCNLFLAKGRDEQYYVYLMHGGALKKTRGSYAIPRFCNSCDIITLSSFFNELEKYNLSCKNNNLIPLGYPRNDDLFRKISLHNAFSEYEFNKVIYWMPTYRQNRFGSAVHSSVSMPIINDKETALKINAVAGEKGVLIVVKIHDAQDVSKIEAFDFSNLIFIKSDFLLNKDFTNYQLLGSCDALLTDYSSVYYDFMLVDKPIGLTWDDFEEYNCNEGFVVDIESVLKGGEKLYNSDDLIGFISRISEGEDVLKTERNLIKNYVFDSTDGSSAVRVVDYIEGKL